MSLQQPPAENEIPLSLRVEVPQLHRLSPLAGYEKRRRIISRLVLTGVIVTAIVAGMFFVLKRRPAAPTTSPDVARAVTSPDEADSIPNVKVALPIREESASISVEQLATVEPYYRADLRARASGVVKKVHGDIGDKVLRGDVLIQIDVPESDQDVAQKTAMVFQRQQELKVSESKVNDAKAAREVVIATIKQREADVQAQQATRDLKKRRFERFKQLASNGTVVGSVLEEEERDFLASDAAVTAAEANVDRARADLTESESKIEGAKADVQLKVAQIDVARKDLERAKVVAEFGNVIAPFDGVIVRRMVDPGSFVQNATSGSSEALVSVSRVDLVTVVAKLPDNIAPLISKNMPAIVQIGDLAGATIFCKVSRFSPSISGSDRTMRVEVDLFNGDEAEYARIVDLSKSGNPDQFLKGINDPIPVRAFPTTSPNHQRLLPGMTGKLKLSISGLGGAFVLPSTAVYSRGGANYILLAENGKTRQIPVRVQLNDGKFARVSIVSKRKEVDGTTNEALEDLNGTEQVVVARQLEIGDGASVKTSLAQQ